MVVHMSITRRHQEIEARFRELVEQADLPAPDAVEYEPDSVMFLWHGPKVAVAVDLERPDALDELEAAGDEPARAALAAFRDAGRSASSVDLDGLSPSKSTLGPVAGDTSSWIDVSSAG
jgi:hypothetical protein